MRTLNRLLSFALLAGYLQNGWAAEPITLFYDPRPPYLIRQDDGSATGLTATPAALAFLHAGIAYRWKIASSNEQLEALKHGNLQACSVGWFKTPEREHWVKYTHAIYQDHPMVVLANKNIAFPADSTLAAVLASQHYTLLVKDQYSYGPTLDAMLATTHPKRMTTSRQLQEMVLMIAAQRADLMLAAQEEAIYYLEKAQLAQGQITLHKFPDMPEGNKRYIICSPTVSDALIEQLNAAIDNN